MQIGNITSVSRRTRTEYKALQNIVDSEESESEFTVDDLHIYAASNLVEDSYQTCRLGMNPFQTLWS